MESIITAYEPSKQLRKKIRINFDELEGRMDCIPAQVRQVYRLALMGSFIFAKVDYWVRVFTLKSLALGWAYFEA